MTKELSGKIAFVTGSGRGLGRTMAERLAELGADVAIHDLDWTASAKYGEAENLGAVAAEIEKHGVRTVAVTGNIGDKAAVAAMKRDIEAKLGTVNVLVNCAGGDIGAAGGKPNPNNALDISLEDIQTLINNNLIGTMLMCQAFVPPMVKAGKGSVINIASAAAHIGVSPEVVYSTLKAAVVHYTRCLAKELMNDGVKSTPSAPARPRPRASRRRAPSIRSAWIRAASPSTATPSPPKSPTRSPSLRPERSKFINGQVLRVDGGFTIFPG